MRLLFAVPVRSKALALPTNWTGRENNLSISDYIAALAGIGNMPRNPFDSAPQNQQASVGAAGGTKESVG